MRKAYGAVEDGGTEHRHRDQQLCDHRKGNQRLFSSGLCSAQPAEDGGHVDREGNA